VAEKELAKPGTLYVVATPIGHLGDLSERAGTVLGQVAIIAAEDTRYSRRLLDHLGHNTPMLSLHAHNEASRCDELIARLRAGDDLALISDAGTPLISDPGQRLVAAVKEADITVCPIPGACAAITALSASGLAAEAFRFVGFPPAKAQARQKLFQDLSTDTATLIFYEAPHRISSSVKAMETAFGPERRACVAREITKRHEQIVTNTLTKLNAQFADSSIPSRGEFVVLVAGSGINEADAPDTKLDTDKLLLELLAELPLKRAVNLVVKLTGMPRNALYERALKLKDRQPAG